MYIVAFGASGQVGRSFVAQAARRGHEVLAVSREPVAFGLPPEEEKRVHSRLGDVLNREFVSGTLQNADVVFSGLGLKRKSGFPWSALASPPDLASRATGYIIEGMRAHNVRRLAAISTAGASETHHKMNLLMRFLVATSNLGAGYRDLARMEALLKQTDLDFMAVRPTRLTSEPLASPVQVVPGGQFRLMAAISRASVAAYMLQQIEEPRFSIQFPTITTTG